MHRIEPSFCSYASTILSRKSNDIPDMFFVLFWLLFYTTLCPLFIENCDSCVSALESMVVIDELCRRWVESRSSQLEGIIRQGVYVASQPVAVRVLTALKFNQVQKIRDGGIEVLDCVLKAFDDRDMEVVRSANVCAVSLTNRGAIDELCNRWASSRNKRLEQIIRQGSYVARQPVAVRVLTALKFNKIQEISNGEIEVLDSVVKALDDRDMEVERAANVYAVSLTNRKTIDELCKRWVENPNPELESIIRKGNYAPDEVSSRALFYFLLGEWQKYEDLDFDHSLLAKAYQSANQEIKVQVSEKAKAEGRIEWIKVLTNITFGFDIEQMTDKDWELSIDILISYLDRKEIWKFLYDSPIIWSKHLLKKLSKISFKWFNKNEEAILKKLFNLVETIENSDFVLSSLYSQIRESTITSFVNSSNYCDKRDSKWKSFVITPDGQMLISSFYNKICFWNLSDGSLLKTLKGYTDEKYCNHSHALSLAVSPNGQILASCQLNCAGIKLHSLPDGNLLKTIRTYEHRVNSLVISSDSKILVSGGDKLILWDLSIGSSIKTLKYVDIKALAISPDNNIRSCG